MQFLSKASLLLTILSSFDMPLSTTKSELGHLSLYQAAKLEMVQMVS